MPPKKRKKTSTARRKAEQASSGSDFSTMKIPDGLSFWKPKAGTYKFDIVGFECGQNNPYADLDEFHYERTYFMHPRVGGQNGRAYCCPAKCVGKKCPICDAQYEMSSDPDADEKTRKALLPKKRQLFLVYVHEEAEKGLQLWEYSYHCFGKLLDSRIQASDDEEDGWIYFYYHDTDGMTLKVNFVEETNPFGKHIEAKHIDFVRRREDLPDEIIDAVVCLDDILKIPTYAELEKAFLQLDDDDPEEEEEEEAPKKKKPVKGKRKKRPDPEPEEEEEYEEEYEEDEPIEEEEDLVDVETEWLKEQGELADDEDEEAIQALTDRAEAEDLDPDEFSTWTELAEELVSLESGEEEPADDVFEEEDEEYEDVEDDGEEEYEDVEEEEDEEEPAPKKKRKKKPEPVEDDDDDFNDFDDDEIPF